MAEDKRIEPNKIEKRSLLSDAVAGFAGGVGAGVGTVLVAQAGNAIDKIKPKPKQ